mmetsp:Transcript_9189/g.26130  ORF Transcript_9189/g.26130 Transcript_9189/m.26130 type:complete len:275 (-) Transcript_9189:625-1449(-)
MRFVPLCDKIDILLLQRGSLVKAGGRGFLAKDIRAVGKADGLLYSIAGSNNILNLWQDYLWRKLPVLRRLPAQPLATEGRGHGVPGHAIAAVEGRGRKTDVHHSSHRSRVPIFVRYSLKETLVQAVGHFLHETALDVPAVCESCACIRDRVNVRGLATGFNQVSSVIVRGEARHWELAEQGCWEVVGSPRPLKLSWKLAARQLLVDLEKVEVVFWVCCGVSVVHLSLHIHGHRAIFDVASAFIHEELEPKGGGGHLGVSLGLETLWNLEDQDIA